MAASATKRIIISSLESITAVEVTPISVKLPYSQIFPVMTQRWVTLCLNIRDLCDKFMYNGYRTSTLPNLISVTLQGSFKLRSLHMAHTEPSP
jgi:hypothetical protein